MNLLPSKFKWKPTKNAREIPYNNFKCVGVRAGYA